MELNNASVTSPMPLKDIANKLRGDIQATADYLNAIKKTVSTFPVPATADMGEVMSNLTLSYRHLEDAKMRLGKVVQAIEGASVYDTPATTNK